MLPKVSKPNLTPFVAPLKNATAAPFAAVTVRFVPADAGEAVPIATAPEAVIVVNAPVVAVVAPTVPLMLMLAVPVKLVTVPLDGVPSAPPFTTNAPAVPVLTPSAVTTPVPVAVVAGVAPAPPPSTNDPAASAAEDAQVDALEK